jgi:hypothetical protein
MPSDAQRTIGVSRRPDQASTSIIPSFRDIVGDSAFGFLVGAFYDTDVEASNQLIDNDLESFNASVASIYLDTNTQNTTVKGMCGTVIDLGTGNHVSCRKVD